MADPKQDEAPKASATNPHAAFVGQVVRYHLGTKFVHEWKEKHEVTGAITSRRSEHPHFNAIVVDVAPDGVATLKVLPHAKGAKHLARQLNEGVRQRNEAAANAARAAKAEPKLEPLAVAKHRHVLEGVKRGTEPGQWAPES
jgi:hypothetical protein